DWNTRSSSGSAWSIATRTSTDPRCSPKPGRSGSGRRCFWPGRCRASKATSSRRRQDCSRVSMPRRSRRASRSWPRRGRRRSAHTARAYASDLAQFLAHVSATLDIPRAKLKPAHLDRLALRGFMAHLHERGLSRASAARKLAAARTFLRYLRREGLLDDDPGAMVPTPKRDIRMPVHLSEGEMGRLVEMPSTDGPLGRRDRAILELFYASGLRLSELTGLDIDDVNLSAQMVRTLGKGGRERLVPFNRSTATASRAYLKDRELLMRSRDHGRVKS